MDTIIKAYPSNSVWRGAIKAWIIWFRDCDLGRYGGYVLVVAICSHPCSNDLSMDGTMGRN